MNIFKNYNFNEIWTIYFLPKHILIVICVPSIRKKTSICISLNQHKAQMLYKMLFFILVNQHSFRFSAAIILHTLFSTVVVEFIEKVINRDGGLLLPLILIYVNGFKLFLLTKIYISVWSKMSKKFFSAYSYQTK